MAVVHDGLKTLVVDSVTQEPVGDAFVYDRLEGKKPRVLALSDNKGALVLEPKSKLIFSALMAEAFIYKQLWVCKDGYSPYLAGSGGGWNSDYRPSVTYTPAVIELTKSSLAQTESCLALKQ
ncbi:MAG: hypothetical protein ACOH1V_03965 [Stenotrophomonas sp.]